ncbi:tumor necrosis factor receptor superfamily member 19L [Zootoca vivipara]|uniref:tumor necrosis factor receptor superfamily member 19L n=1 Tax=Zootoca vivipara TaxID=8524 RepID=UPI00293B8B7D|nr:tumor necrosis factor receptor superfamily member 19L [Zootoca vivipara]
MKRTLNFCSAFILLMAFFWHQAQACGSQEYWSSKGYCVPCEGCPPGEEPDRTCGYGKGLGMICKACSEGSFSSSYGLEFCSPHTHCEGKRRVHASPGTAAADTLCGDCMPGYYSPEGETDPNATCLPCLSAPKGLPGCSGSRRWLTRLTRNAEALQRRDNKAAANSTREGKPEESATQYAVLAIVPVFCVMGLLGILFCNLLMKKGYHCTAHKDTDEEGAKSERNGEPGQGQGGMHTCQVAVREIRDRARNSRPEVALPPFWNWAEHAQTLRVPSYLTQGDSSSFSSGWSGGLRKHKALHKRFPVEARQRRCLEPSSTARCKPQGCPLHSQACPTVPLGDVLAGKPCSASAVCLGSLPGLQALSQPTSSHLKLAPLPESASSNTQGPRQDADLSGTNGCFLGTDLTTQQRSLPEITR